MNVQSQHVLETLPCFDKSSAHQTPSSQLVDSEKACQCLTIDQQDGSELKSQLQDFQLTEEMEDQLDSQTVANELISDWASREAIALAPAKNCSRSPLPTQIRDALLRFMCHFTQLMNLPKRSWFEAATLLDVYCLHRPGGPDIGLMPTTCVAIVRMLKKSDNAALCMQGSNLSAHAAQLAQWIQKLGYATQETTEEQLNIQESELLAVLRWQVNLPSLESWLQTFCTRFNVLTRSFFTPSMQWIWEQSILYARVLVMRQAAGTGGLSPRDIACGLLGLTLVSARLLPLEAFRSQKLSAEAWEELFMKSQQQAAVPTCVLHHRISHRVLELLQVTTGRSLSELQDATEGVAKVLSDALSEIQSMQRAQTMQASPVQREQ